MSAGRVPQVRHDRVGEWALDAGSVIPVVRARIGATETQEGAS